MYVVVPTQLFTPVLRTFPELLSENQPEAAEVELVVG